MGDRPPSPTPCSPVSPVPSSQAAYPGSLIIGPGSLEETLSGRNRPPPIPRAHPAHPALGTTWWPALGPVTRARLGPHPNPVPPAVLPSCGLAIAQKFGLVFFFLSFSSSSFFFLSWTFFLCFFFFFFVLSYFFSHGKNQKSIASMRVNPEFLNPSTLDIWCCGGPSCTLQDV